MIIILVRRKVNEWLKYDLLAFPLSLSLRFFLARSRYSYSDNIIMMI